MFGPSTHTEVSPLLSLLHQAQERDGCLTAKALEDLAASLRRPVADIYSAASFYHYFIVDGDPPRRGGGCRGPVCSLPAASSEGGPERSSIPCPGLCDHAPAKYDGGRFFAAGGETGALSLPRAVKSEEALFRHIRSGDRRRLENYRRSGGYEQWSRLLESQGVEAALATLARSGLSGRGGAAFALAAKWKAVRDAPGGVKYIVCNADEGEPGTFKDRPLLHLEPHLLLEAMAIAGYIVGANAGVIYLRYEYPRALEILAAAIAEAETAGLLGRNIGGSGFDFDVCLRRGAGSYVCGEETALLNSLEGLRPWPRERPPFPTTHGLDGKPTIVNNVETLCFVPLILERGAEWFRSLGRGENAGTKIYSVSGRARRPGNYELPLGVSAGELIVDCAGGPPPERKLKAFTLGGISGGLLGADHLDLALDYKAPQRLGAALGSGGVIVLDDRCCVVDFARSCMRFYESESCGKCVPCRVGTVRLRELLDGLTGRGDFSPDAQTQMATLANAMAAASACGLGQSAPLVVTGMFKFFGEEFNAHLKDRSCPAGVCRL